MIWTLSNLNIITTITNVDIVVGNSPDWLVLPIDLMKRIYNSF